MPQCNHPGLFSGDALPHYRERERETNPHLLRQIRIWGLANWSLLSQTNHSLPWFLHNVWTNCYFTGTEKWKPLFGDAVLHSWGLYGYDLAIRRRLIARGTLMQLALCIYLLHVGTHKDLWKASHFPHPRPPYFVFFPKNLHWISPFLVLFLPSHPPVILPVPLPPFSFPSFPVSGSISLGKGWPNCIVPQRC